ncbi:MAG: ribonuclease Y [Acidobacteriota bacterium]
MAEYLIFAVISGAAVALWLILRLRFVEKRLQAAQREAESIREQAQEEAERLKREKLVEAKDEIFRWRVAAEKEIQDQRKKLTELERRVNEKEHRLDRQSRQLERRRRDVEQRLRAVKRREAEVAEAEQQAEALLVERRRQLELVSGMTQEEAKRMLLESIEAEARHEGALLARRIEDEAREKAEIEARKIISTAIQRCAAEHVVETTVSVVDLPSDEMKGRIIGREGRNIRALEQATGVDLIVDDTPEAVILSCFDPLRREIARVAIEQLIRDGRIHPARIEEVVAKVEADFETKLRQEGEQVAFELGIHNLHENLLTLLGKLRYRTSYGQNVLYHSRDVAYLAGLMAQEVGANVEVCRRAGLLHDIGKAVDRDVDGTHLQIGVELARKYGESEEVVHAIEAHHFDVEFRTIEAVLVQSADALSAARPGARREVLESYIKRLEKLEELAQSFSGVAKAFALQAGREIRVVVDAGKISDEDAYWLTKDIAKRIEKDLEYPGQIKVTLIREMRVVDYAR